MSKHTKFEWAEKFVLNEIDSTSKLCGYYNHNYLAHHNGEPYIVRIPIPKSDAMDIRRIPEECALKSIEKNNIEAPRLLYIGQKSAFYVHSFVDGSVLNDTYGDNIRIPDWILMRIVEEMIRLHTVNIVEFAQKCQDLATSPDAQCFFLSHLSFDVELYERLRPEMVTIYQQLGFPSDPFAKVGAVGRQLSPRQFVLCHSDIHRKNIIFREQNKEITILDWELALVGDPVYDIAVHFHKMRYQEDQEYTFIQRYCELANWPANPGFLREEIDVYLSLERIKSALVDAFRARSDLKSKDLTGAEQRELAARYARKAVRAHEVWGSSWPEAQYEPSRLVDLLSA